MLTFKLMIETEPQSLEKPTADSAIADARRLLSLGEPRYAMLACRLALEALLLDACNVAMVWPVSRLTGEPIKLRKKLDIVSHFLASHRLITPELNQRITILCRLTGEACHPYAIRLDKVYLVLQIVEELQAAVRGIKPAKSRHVSFEEMPPRKETNE